MQAISSGVLTRRISSTANVADSGAPLLAVENVEDSVRIDSFLLGGNDKITDGAALDFSRTAHNRKSLGQGLSMR